MSLKFRSKIISDVIPEILEIIGDPRIVAVKSDRCIEGILDEPEFYTLTLNTGANVYTVRVSKTNTHIGFIIPDC